MMKLCSAAIWLFFFQNGARADNFGPGACVGVNRSDKGSCLIKTDCKGQDIKTFEFAFTCTLAQGEIEKHSYGLGGFADNEEYDTEVKCNACHAPPDAIVAQSAAALEGAAARKKAPAAEEVSEKDAAGKVAFGPGQCVSTYKSEGGTCIVQTDCTREQIADYDFGMVCAEADGTLSRHLFGKGSFAPKETFDTLIECKQCMGMDAVADDGVLVTQVQALRTEVAAMKKDLEGVKVEVETISDAIEKNAAAKKDSAVAETEKKEVTKTAAQVLVKHSKKSGRGGFMAAEVKASDKIEDGNRENHNVQEEDGNDDNTDYPNERVRAEEVEGVGEKNEEVDIHTGNDDDEAENVDSDQI